MTRDPPRGFLGSRGNHQLALQLLRLVGLGRDFQPVVVNRSLSNRDAIEIGGEQDSGDLERRQESVFDALLEQVLVDWFAEVLERVSLGVDARSGSQTTVRPSERRWINGRESDSTGSSRSHYPDGTRR